MPVSATSLDVASLLRTALTLHQAGRLDEAEQLYRRILAAEPRHFDGLHLLGAIFSQRGDHAAAVRQIDAAIVVNPNVAAAHNNRGAALSALGRLEEALASYDRAVALMPDYIDAARSRADALMGLGRFEDAVAAYDRAGALDPKTADLLLKRGQALMALNRVEQAVDSYDGAIARDPGYRDAHLNRGIALSRLGRFDDAVASYDRAIALDPTGAEAFSNRGATLRALRRFDDAVASHDRAVALAPRHASVHNNRGVALKDMGRLDEALASFDAAIGLQPAFGEAYSNRANALAFFGRYDAAMADYAQAVTVNPGDANARCNGGMIKLLTGRFAAGWEDWEARWDVGGQLAPGRRGFARPQWTGDVDIRGKRMLLVPEQGAGDTIMAVRYARLVADRGATVILEAPRALRSLLGPVSGVSEIVTQGDPLPDFDFHCPLLSLPRAFKTTLDTIPVEVPYLGTSAAHLDKWRTRLPQAGGLRVGINWAGNPEFRWDKLRSIGLARMLPVLGVRNVQFFALQKDLHDGDAGLLRDHPHVTWLGRDIETFADTAAIIAHLDLVISSDTSVVHLAGALGKPVWILLPFNPDWRWLLDRGDSPWYPTARLFRQSLYDDWTGVVERVSAEIGQLVEGLKSAPS